MASVEAAEKSIMLMSSLGDLGDQPRYWDVHTPGWQPLWLWYIPWMLPGIAAMRWSLTLRVAPIRAKTARTAVQGRFMQRTEAILETGSCASKQKDTTSVKLQYKEFGFCMLERVAGCLSARWQRLPGPYSILERKAKDWNMLLGFDTVWQRCKKSNWFYRC